MIGNSLLRQVLGGVLGQAMRRRGLRHGGPFGRGLGGVSLGAALAGMLGGRGAAATRTRGLGAGRTALLLAVLPMVLRWVERNGGIGAVLRRFQQRGYDHQARSWVARGPNEVIDVEAVEKVVGRDELDRAAATLGVPERQAAAAYAEVVPEVVDQLSPEGQVPERADEVLEEGRAELERELAEARARAS